MQRDSPSCRRRWSLLGVVVVQLVSIFKKFGSHLPSGLCEFLPSRKVFALSSYRQAQALSDESSSRTSNLQLRVRQSTTTRSRDNRQRVAHHVSRQVSRIHLSLESCLEEGGCSVGECTVPQSKITSALWMPSRGLHDSTTLQRMQADDEISGEKSNFQYVSLAIFRIPRDPVKMRQDCLKTPSRSLHNIYISSTYPRKPLLTIML